VGTIALRLRLEQLEIPAQGVSLDDESLAADLALVLVSWHLPGPPTVGEELLSDGILPEHVEGLQHR
jgi:hypothetical protein